MNREDETEKAFTRRPADDQAEADLSAARAGFRRTTGTGRSFDNEDSRRVQPAPLPPFKVQPSILKSNPPSHPAWEKPLRPYNYPTIRGQEKRQTMKPLIFAVVGVFLVLGLALAFPALTRHSAAAPSASDSSSPVATDASSRPTRSVAASTPTAPAGTPVVISSFAQYKVVAGDSVAKIALKKGLQRWELLLANPGLVGPNYTLHINQVLNIPVPGQLTQPPSGPTPLPPGVTPTPTVAAP